MRVAMLHNRYRSGQPSGENTVVDQTTDFLRTSGHVVELYAQHSDDIAQMSRKDRALLPFRSVWSFTDERDLTFRLQSARPDIVHVHNTFPLFSPSVLRAAARQNLPVVATLHNFRLMCANGVLQRDGGPCESCIGKIPWRGAVHGCYRDSKVQSLPLVAGITVHRTLNTWQRYVTTLIAPSEFVRSRYVAGGFDPDRIVVKPHAVAHSGAVREGAGEAVVFLGRLTEEKGFADLLSAWDASLGQLVVVGDGPLRAEADERARRDPSVRVLGALPWMECMEVLRSASALVVPARSYETFGLVVIEAFAHGVPVVASRIGALEELVDDGETGALVSPGDTEALRKALGVLVEPATSIAFGQRARQVYLDRFTPERDLAATERIYTDAIARHAADRNGARGQPRDGASS
ncbi:glycosyltransferase family 4 protein [Kribbella sp. CA-293567]|uniref:glycosyltransferase family 4 protein n=1 Tax=Kribbella sp. CA-293567 TaxID=3002436 RepID=UPI0022DE26FF|nr:glycosyltransferase family 4 protein [Kribbella sp. CA-293567]WBQ02708.1 glycosyltransferase family 4 protein [Kribbella sp. CA-293567]